jgi:hypothetical protein
MPPGGAAIGRATQKNVTALTEFTDSMHGCIQRRSKLRRSLLIANEVLHGAGEGSCLREACIFRSRNGWAEDKDWTVLDPL